jgi:predicted DNA-binding protein
MAMYRPALKAQDLGSDPGKYMDAISNAMTDMNKTYMAYLSATAHSHRARKIEKMRQQTLQSITDCRYKINDLPYYKGDNSLRQSSIDYVKLCYSVFSEDYGHIVNMEEIAEQSFDEMEAYLLLQEKTNERIRAASDSMDLAEKVFAAKYSIHLVNTTSELSEKMGVADKLTHYYNEVFLLFFKCNWQDGEITKQINQKDLKNIEQSRNSLDNFANEGLKALDTLRQFEGDATLANACAGALRTYKHMAEVELPKVEDFYLKQDNFDKLKAALDAKPQGSRTQQDIDSYNNAVKDVNASVNTYNQQGTQMNNDRKTITDNWNNAEKSFMDAHMPHYKA